MTEVFRLRILVAIVIILIACKEDDSKTQNPPVSHDTFTNPLLLSAPDPWVQQKDDWYYFTHTTGNSLRLYRTKEMSELSQAEVKTIWNPPSTGMNSKNIWAPEIQFLQDKWYFYYAADDGKNENHRMWVLENSAADPFQGQWIDKGKLQLPDDKWVIDGSAFEHNGQLYYLWSGWEGGTNVRQDIYISKMTDPLTPTGDRVMLSRPEFAWEKNGGTPEVNEAPQFLSHGDKVFIVYSASGCWTDDYTLGILSADSDADLMDPTSWTKSTQPVFVKNSSAEAFAPGHNSFFKSPDGTEDWIIYHANAASGDGCGSSRSTRMQKFTWTQDGFPNFGEPVALGSKLSKPSGDD